jgi:hypothetical protein
MMVIVPQSAYFLAPFKAMLLMYVIVLTDLCSFFASDVLTTFILFINSGEEEQLLNGVESLQLLTVILKEMK